MRLVDETLILQNLECLQESPWYNDGKDPESGRRWQFNIRKEAAEIVRDLCIRPVPTVDAIPVEWVEKRLDDMLKGSFSFEECGAIAALLSDWRKGREAKQ